MANDKTYTVLDVNGGRKGTFSEVAKIECIQPGNIVQVYSDTELIGVVNLGPGETIGYTNG